MGSLFIVRWGRQSIHVVCDHWSRLEARTLRPVEGDRKCVHEVFNHRRLWWGDVSENLRVLAMKRNRGLMHLHLGRLALVDEVF